MKNLILACLAGLLLGGCASKTERQFIAGCKSGGVEADVCECVYDRLVDKYGEKNFKDEERLFALYQTESFQHDMVHNSLQCMKE